MTANIKASTWKQFFLESQEFNYSNKLLSKIKEAGSAGNTAEKIFTDFSRNPGIGFLSLDASEENLQLFHHPTILGGSWMDEEIKLVALCGLNNKATPIQVVPKSLKEIKVKAPKSQDIISALSQARSFETIDKISKNSPNIHYKNMIPIPDLLLKTFVQLNKVDPESVAKAFYETMVTFDAGHSDDSTDIDSGSETEIEEDDGSQDIEKTPVISSKTNNRNPSDNTSSFLSSFDHVLQFCYLCKKGKIPPLLFTVATDNETIRWFDQIEHASISTIPSTIHSTHGDTSTYDDDDTAESYRSLRESKDTHIVHTLLKISETLDQNSLRATAETEKKEPGFKKLEPHRQQLILNASATHPFDRAASTPTPFYLEFLSQKQQFKAKELLCHHLAKNKVLFQPSAAFAAHLYSVEWVWSNPNKPSGISIFFCPDASSEEKYNDQNSSFERGLSLLEKIEKSDIGKLTKQTITLPTGNMNAYLMVKNYKAIINLCFGEESQSALCLQSWCDHIFDNRQLYMGWEESDPSFHTKVLYAIDKSLQIHWKSCYDCNDRSSVNDKILFMHHIQNDIESQRFFYQLPKAIQDKLKPTEDTNDPNSGKDHYRKGKKRFQDDRSKDNLRKQRIQDNHQQWHLKDGESFADLFYPHQDKCPKTQDGSFICMKFFLRGFCDKSCNRAHKLSKSEEKAFDNFVNNCRKKDFPQGAGTETP